VLQKVLIFSPLLLSIHSHLVSIIDELLKMEDCVGEFMTTSANSTWVLGSCLHALAGSRTSTWKHNVDLRRWAKSILEKWSWSESVMTSFVKFVNKMYVCTLVTLCFKLAQIHF
jgi:U3 small nucleolar RNA-associated protein 20